MRKYIIFFGVATLLSCHFVLDGSEKRIKKKMYKALQGKWDWVKTSCCHRQPKISTPAAGEQKSLQFLKTKEVLYFTNGKQDNKGTYEVIFNQNTSDRPFLMLSERGTQAIVRFSPKKDTLIIDYGYMDLETSWYVRSK